MHTSGYQYLTMPTMACAGAGNSPTHTPDTSAGFVPLSLNGIVITKTDSQSGVILAPLLEHSEDWAVLYLRYFFDPLRPYSLGHIRTFEHIDRKDGRQQ